MKKFKKEDLGARHAVKLRDYGNCVILEQYLNGSRNMITYSKNELGNFIGNSDISKYDDSLKDAYGNSDFDIMAIKEFRSTSEAIGAIINEKKEINWDWERKELKEITSLDQLEEVRKNCVRSMV